MYLLLGAADKLVLEYEWVEIKAQSDSVFELNTKLTNMLRRLIHLAATEFADYSKNKHVSIQHVWHTHSKVCMHKSFKLWN